MLPGLDVIVMTGVLNAAAGVSCTVPKAPDIIVTPQTAPIQYDFSRSSAELGTIKSDTANPYGPGVDTATGGLREDRANTRVEVRVGYRQYSNGPACLWYDSVNVTIDLAPKVYVAKEHDKGPCHDAILAHEKRHVQVDREVINQYVVNIGAAVRAAVDRTGAKGPVDRADLPRAQQDMSGLIKQVVAEQRALMEQDMRRRQAKVDSLEEYQRIGAICSAAEKRR